MEHFMSDWGTVGCSRRMGFSDITVGLDLFIILQIVLKKLSVTSTLVVSKSALQIFENIVVVF